MREHVQYEMSVWMVFVGSTQGPMAPTNKFWEWVMRLWVSWENAFVLLRNTDVDKPCHSWTQRAMFSGTPYRQSSILIILIKRVCVESIQPQHRHWKKIACVSKLNLRYTESRVVWYIVQTDRQAGRQTARQTDRQPDRERERERETDRQTDRQRERQSAFIPRV